MHRRHADRHYAKFRRCYTCMGIQHRISGRCSVANTVIGIQLDASGPVSVQIAKVADAIVPTSARNLFTTDQPGIDECWFPGCGDFRGFKMRFQFTAQNSVTLRRANYEGLLLPGTKGG